MHSGFPTVELHKPSVVQEEMHKSSLVQEVGIIEEDVPKKSRGRPNDKFSRRVAQCGIDPRKVCFCVVGVDGAKNENENKKERETKNG